MDFWNTPKTSRVSKNKKINLFDDEVNFKNVNRCINQ